MRMKAGMSITTGIIMCMAQEAAAAATNIMRSTHTSMTRPTTMKKAAAHLEKAAVAERRALSCTAAVNDEAPRPV